LLLVVLFAFRNLIGDASQVDMTVGDIYGQNIVKYEHLGLTSDLLACRYAQLLFRLIYTTLY
jgi:pantothenate kinase